MFADSVPTILNVEDYAISRDATSQLLREAGFAVLEAANGAEALQLAQQACPHLVLLDVKLPDITGYEVCQRLKADPATRAIPVLQISGSFVATGDLERGKASGADGYLVKPVESAELIAAIRALLRMRQAEEARQEIATRYELLFAGCSLPIWAFDTETLRLLAVNEAAVRSYGYSRNDFLQRTVKDIWLPEREPVAFTPVSACPYFAVNPAQWRHRRKDGSLIEVEGDWHEAVFSGRQAVVVISRDITERNQLEAERALRLAREQALRAEAEAAARAKDEFLAVISHELRTPLNAVLGWTRILRSQEPDQRTLTHALEVIERNAEAQMRVVEDLLDISTVVNGKLRLRSEPVDLVAEIHTACESLRPAITANRIRLNLDLQPAGALVIGDAGRLRQVVWNLLSNAVKFTPPGGQVEVSLARVEAGVRIVVSDNGKGIGRELLPHVFDLFRQGDSTPTRHQGGLGLGLSLVRRLVELHGGKVEADSAGPGQGASFTVELPAQAAPAPSPLIVAQSDARLKTEEPLKGLWVVAVDDEAEARELITVMLEQYGAEVTVAASAAEAITKIRNEHAGRSPDLLISDISMPGEDGYSLIRRVRALEAELGRPIPAVALTAYSRAEDRLKALSAGFQTHVPKPVEADELVAVVVSLAERFSKRAMSPPTSMN